jgi:hypothetical protein
MHSTSINAQSPIDSFLRLKLPQPTLSTPTILTTSTTTMFSKVFITALALVGAVSAVPTGSGSGGSTTPSQQCCQNVENSQHLDSATQGLLGGLLTVVLSGLNIPIGTGCTPIAVLGGVSCNQNNVNCGSTYSSELPILHTHPAYSGTDSSL